MGQGALVGTQELEAGFGLGKRSRRVLKGGLVVQMAGRCIESSTMLRAK